jgi:hypothetical protein
VKVISLLDADTPESDGSRGNRLMDALQGCLNLFPFPSQESTSDSANTVQAS